MRNSLIETMEGVRQLFTHRSMMQEAKPDKTPQSTSTCKHTPYDFFYIPETEGVESLVMSKHNTHHSNIIITPNILPSITLDTRPKHNEFIHMKQSLINVCIKCFDAHLSYVKNLPPVAKDSSLVRLVDIIARDVISRYWDMPSSKAIHHNYAWGHLIHSFSVASAEAERGARWKPFTEVGVDQIVLQKYSGYVTLIHFVKGLYHDAYKIHQYSLAALSKKELKIFQPLTITGQILDFKLAYPDIVREQWQSLPVHPGRLNFIEAAIRLPRDFFSVVPFDCIMQLFFSMEELTSIEADKVDSLKDTLKNEALYEKVKLGVYQYFTMDWQSKPTKYVFRVNEQWTAVHYDQFVGKVMQVSDFSDKTSFTLYLIERKILFAIQTINGELLYASPTSFYLRSRYSHEETKEKCNIAFISTAFISECYPEALRTCHEAYFDAKDLAPFEYLLIQIQDKIRAAYDELCKETERVKDSPTEQTTPTKKDLKQAPQPQKTGPAVPKNQDETGQETSSQESSSIEIKVKVEENTPASPLPLTNDAPKKRKKKGAMNGPQQALPASQTMPEKNEADRNELKQQALESTPSDEKEIHSTPQETILTEQDISYLTDRLQVFMNRKNYEQLIKTGTIFIDDTHCLYLCFPTLIKEFYFNPKTQNMKEPKVFQFLQHEGYISENPSKKTFGKQTYCVATIVEDKKMSFLFYQNYLESKES